MALHDGAELLAGPEKNIVRYHRGQMVLFGSRFVHGGSSYLDTHFRAFAYISDATFVPGNETDPYVPVPQDEVLPGPSRDMQDQPRARLRSRRSVSYSGMEEDVRSTKPHLTFFSVAKKSAGWEWSNLEVAFDPSIQCDGLRVKIATSKGTGLPIFGCVMGKHCGTTHAWKYVRFGAVWPAEETVCGCAKHPAHGGVPAWGLGAWAKINESATPNCFIWANCIWLMDNVPAGTFLTVNYNITHANRGVRGYHLLVCDEEVFQRSDADIKAYVSKHKTKLFRGTCQRFRGPLHWLREKQSAVLH